MAGEEVRTNNRKREDGKPGAVAKLVDRTFSPNPPLLSNEPEREGNEEDWREWRIAKMKAWEASADQRAETGQARKLYRS